MRGMTRTLGQALDRGALWLGLTGGLLLMALAGVTALSVMGRRFGPGPITGDFELVEAGCAIAIFSFLPLCQMRRGHVCVDILARALPARANAVLQLLGDLLVALAALAILWQLWLGFGEKFPFGSDTVRDLLSMGYRPFFPETTYELQLPYWVAYAACLPGAALFALAALWSVLDSLSTALLGRAS